MRTRKEDSLQLENTLLMEFTMRKTRGTTTKRPTKEENLDKKEKSQISNRQTILSERRCGKEGDEETTKKDSLKDKERRRKEALREKRHLRRLMQH
jgi:hypothetical protein